MKAILKILLLLVSCSGATLLGSATAKSRQPAKAWFNGTILTMDDNQPTAEAVLVRGDRIVALGSRTDIEALMDSETVVHDLAGTTMLPGLVDAHSHFPASGIALFLADLRSPPVGLIETIPQLLERVSAQVEKTPAGKWVGGYGYDQLMLSEKRHPSLARA